MRTSAPAKGTGALRWVAPR